MIVGFCSMEDMDKLMDFLQKEVPSSAGDLNNSINTILEIIERTHAAVREILNKHNPNLFQSFPDDESMQGRTITYFSRKQMKYACKKVGGTDIYVLTNNNGNGNYSIIIKMLEKYNIPTTSMEIFLKADYSPLHEDDENVKKLNIDDNATIGQEINIDESSDTKIGQRAREYFAKYFSDTSKQYDLKNFLNKYRCHDTFGICYPLLKEVDVSVPISKQKGYNNNYGRYWTKIMLEINDKHYIICSQWYKEFQGKLDK